MSPAYQVKHRTLPTNRPPSAGEWSVREGGEFVAQGVSEYDAWKEFLKRRTFNVKALEILKGDTSMVRLGFDLPVHPFRIVGR